MAKWFHGGTKPEKLPWRWGKVAGPPWRQGPRNPAGSGPRSPLGVLGSGGVRYDHAWLPSAASARSRWPLGPVSGAGRGLGDRRWPSVRRAARVSAGAAWFARGGRGSVLDPASARALGLTRGALSRSCGHDLTLRLPVPPWHERRAARDNGTRAHRAPLRGAGCCARTDRVRPAATRLTRSLGAGRRQTPHPPAGHRHL